MVCTCARVLENGSQQRKLLITHSWSWPITEALVTASCWIDIAPICSAGSGRFAITLFCWSCISLTRASLFDPVVSHAKIASIGSLCQMQCCCQGLETQGQGQGQGLTPSLITLHTWFCMCNMKNSTFKTLFFLKII